ncbi:MAG: NUDIX hydrolase [Firmicutes bacterium]|nr:NUDIX hydrolase [Bacillota bacterium]
MQTGWQRVRNAVVRWMARYLPRWVMQFLMWITQAKFLVAVVAVIWQGERVLLLKHSYRPRYPWGLPTGWIKSGESLDVAVAREVKEETGIVVNQVHWFYSQSVHRHHLEVGCWMEVAPEDAPVSMPSSDGEILGTQWVPYGEWPEGLLPTQIAVIERAYGERAHIFRSTIDK